MGPLFADGAAKHFDERRIKGSTGLLFDVRQRFFARDGQGAGLIGSEAVEGLRECDDARQEGDAFLFQTERIAGTVPALVMQRNNLHGFGGKSYRSSDACTKVGSMVAAGIIVLQYGTAWPADQIQIVSQGAKSQVLLINKR